MQRHIGSGLALAAAVCACSSSPPTGNAAAGASLALVTGGGQAQVAGYVLPDTIVVRLLDADNQPMPFAPIDATVDAINGSPFASVAAVDARTRADGTARFTWRLGLTLGAQELRVTSTATAAVAPLVISATATSHGILAMAGSESGACVIDLSGRLACWSPLSDPVQPPRLVAHPTELRFTALAIHPLANGGQRGCAIATTGRVWCFELDGADITSLTELPGVHPTLAGLTTGGGSPDADPPFCALTSDGAAWCWGSNATGVLGDGTTLARVAPAPVATQTRFSKLAVGSHHACGLTATGEIWCWGSNASAQVGIAAGATPVTIPRRITEQITFVDVAVVSDHATCGVSISGGGAWCWGRKVDLGIGQYGMAQIAGPSTPRAAFVSNLVSPLAIGRVDDAVVAVGPPGNGAWWGDLSAIADEVLAVTPRPFIKSLGLRSLAMAASSGLVCGALDILHRDHLCARMTTVSGYSSHGVHPEFAGFGVPFP